MDGKKSRDWKDYISDEKIMKSFSINIETLGYIKLFMDEYGIEDQNQALEKLVSLGLEKLNYKDLDLNFKKNNISYEEPIVEKTRVANDKEEAVNITSPVQRNQNFEFNALAFENQDIHPQERIYGIISDICKNSLNGYASKEDIITQAERYSISKDDILSTIDYLKKNKRIYEPVENRFKNQ